MGLLSKLKSVLGMEEESRSAGSGVDVTVEHDPSTESEDAAEQSTAESDADVDEPVATETDAAASTESLVDEEQTDDPSRSAEPAEAGVTDDGQSEADADDGQSEADAGDGQSEADAGDGQSEADAEDDVDTTEATDEGNTESVSTVKGIGPAYASRLEEAGVETVADLATVDPEELAERVDLSAKRVGRWVDRAKDRN